MTAILVVDDSPTMRRMVTQALRPLEADVAEAGNGLSAIEELALQRYDVMVLDLNMPDMHGEDVIRFVRGHAAYRDLPIVVLSTRGDDASRQSVMQAGANTYLTKPFASAELLSVVRHLLHQ